MKDPLQQQRFRMRWVGYCLAFIWWSPFVSANTPRDTMQLAIPLASPITDWDALGTSYLTLQQCIGGVDRALVNHYGDPKAGLPRLGEMVLLAWPNLALGFYAHELGHDIASEWWGPGYRRWLQWNDWIPQPWPLYKRDVSGEQRFAAIYDSLGRVNDWQAMAEWRQNSSWMGVRGIDQEEWDAVLLYRQGNQVLSWDEGLAFTFRKLSALTYELYSGSAYGTQFAEGQLDVTGYIQDMQARGLSTNRWDWYGPAILATGLSFRLWESMWMDMRFLAGGPRTKVPWKWRSRGWEVIPPLVELDYTPWGAWHQLYIPIRSPHGWELEAQFGHDADWMAAGDLRAMRIGGSLATPKIPIARSHVWVVRPHVRGAYTLRRAPLGYAGYLAGAGILVQWQRWMLATELRKSEGDLVENHIHNRSQGYGQQTEIQFAW